MGQYLTIGIATVISISKDRAKREALSITPEKIRETLESYYNKSGIYTVEETGGSVSLRLRPEVAEADLLDLLRDFYAIRYTGNGKIKRIVELMDELRSHTKWDEWMEIANDKRYECFQHDQYVITSTPYQGGWTSSLTTHVEQIILSIDGKIIMECWGNLFEFFARLIKEKLSNYRLAESLMVNISG